MTIDWGPQPPADGQPADPGQWGYPGQPDQLDSQRRTGPAGPGNPRQRGPRLALTALVLGAVVLAFSGYQVYTAFMPRKFTPGQQQQIMAWEVAARWRELPAGSIFPASASYPPPQALQDGGALTLTTQRLGIARQVTCQQATDPAAAAVLGQGDCEAMLRATYVDGTGSFVVTVGVAAFPTAAQAGASAQSLSASAGTAGTGTLAPGVRAVSFAGTLASGFTDARRQLSGSVSAGPYVVLYTIGYSDGRPTVAVAGDGYTLAEMTSMGEGLASKIADSLAASPPAPRCPGAPEC